MIVPTFSIAVVFVAIATGIANADCQLANITNGSDVTYNFSCPGEICVQWKLYILDYPAPLSRHCSNLPCMIDMSSLSSNVTALKRTLSWKAAAGGRGCWGTITVDNAVPSALLMLAQSFVTYRKSNGTIEAVRVGEVMIRSVPNKSPEPSATIIFAAVTLEDFHQQFTATQDVSATPAPDAGSAQKKV